MAREKTTKSVNTEVGDGGFRVDPVLFGKEDPHKLLGAASPPVAPEGDESGVSKGPNFSGRKGSDLNPVEGLGNSRSSNHFLLGAKGDRSSPDDAGTTSARGEAISVRAPNMGPSEVGVGTEDTMGIMDWDEALEESS